MQREVVLCKQKINRSLGLPEQFKANSTISQQSNITVSVFVQLQRFLKRHLPRLKHHLFHRVFQNRVFNICVAAVEVV